MGEDSRARLRRELGDQAAEALGGLGDAEVDRLAAMIEQARTDQRNAMRAAAESSLGFVPRFARGAVKRIVFG